MPSITIFLKPPSSIKFVSWNYFFNRRKLPCNIYPDILTFQKIYLWQFQQWNWIFVKYYSYIDWAKNPHLWSSTNIIGRVMRWKVLPECFGKRLLNIHYSHQGDNQMIYKFELWNNFCRGSCNKFHQFFAGGKQSQRALFFFKIWQNLFYYSIVDQKDTTVTDGLICEKQRPQTQTSQPLAQWLV